MSQKIISVLLLAAFTLPAAADAIRSVDKDGNVTFSDQPVPDSVEAEKISIDAPPPPQEQMTESQREAQAVIDKANRIQPHSDAASQGQNMNNTAATQDPENARKQLEKAKIVGEGDRQGTAGGGSRLTPAYQERVRKAEQAVSDAERQPDKTSQ